MRSDSASVPWKAYPLASVSRIVRVEISISPEPISSCRILRRVLFTALYPMDVASSLVVWQPWIRSDSRRSALVSVGSLYLEAGLGYEGGSSLGRNRSWMGMVTRVNLRSSSVS